MQIFQEKNLDSEMSKKILEKKNFEQKKMRSKFGLGIQVSVQG